MTASTARYIAILGTALALVLAAAGCGRTAGAPSADTASASLPATTLPAKGPVKQVTWALYRDINTLDPAFAYDYPENTVVSTMCEALERQQPNGSITPGLASLRYATPTKIILTLRHGIHFWDGHPLTPADVVFSLRRQSGPKLGGFYGSVFDRVRSITAVGAHQVQITLSQPDYWLAGELSAMPGVIIEKQYAEAKGHAYGTPGGGVMCTGPFKLKAWRPGAEIDVVANHSYWDPSLRPQVGEIRFEGTGNRAPDLERVAAQHEGLVRALEAEGVEVVFAEAIDARFTKAIYTRDPLASVPGGVIIGRLAPLMRRGEEASITRAVAARGVPVLRTIVGTGMLEGGSLVKLGPTVAAFGTSIRCNADGAEQLRDTLRWLGLELVVVPLSGFSIHLDGHLGMVDTDKALVNAAGLPYWFIERLRELSIEPIWVEPDERWAVNCLAVRPGRVLVANDCPRTIERLERRGVEVIAIPYDEIHHNGGGIHCSTMELLREPAS